MTTTLDFNLTFDRLIGHEQGYANDPNDPGGETNWGISKRSYPELDILNLTREDAKAIYFRDFWTPIGGESLPASVSFQLFDFAVNSGIETAVRYFQRALGVADDGYFGPESRKAASIMDEPDMIMGLTAERLDFMTRLKNWPNHGKGWARRIAKQLKFAVVDTPL